VHKEVIHKIYVLNNTVFSWQKIKIGNFLRSLYVCQAHSIVSNYKAVNTNSFKIYFYKE